MAKATKATGDDIVVIKPLERGTVTIFIIGSSPLMMNRMAKKATEELLMPRRSMNKAARAQNLKHNPPEEFRDSVYRCRDGAAPTFIHIPSTAIKKAAAQAALDMEGATKAEIGRLIQIVDPTVHVYGKPFLHMGVVRMAGFAKTPDIRTRAIFPEWCCKFTVQYIKNRIRQQDIANLLDAAGDIVGIGDGRTEKGTFNYGSWRVVTHQDADWNRIARTQGRKVQEAAMDKPEAYDADTEELLAWFHSELVRREIKPASPVAAPRRARRTNGAGAGHAVG